MAYRVIKFFTDMQDGNHEYKVGDTYPREGVKVSPARIHELSTGENRQNEPLIQEAEELKAEKAVSKEVKKAKPKRKAKAQ